MLASSEHGGRIGTPPVQPYVQGSVSVVNDHDDVVVARARRGDVLAFEALIERHDRALRGLAFRLLGDRDRMDDAMQEAYLKAFRALPGFAGTSAVRTWLFRIVYNACMDELRKARRAPLPLDSVEAEPGAGPDPGVVAGHRRDLAVALDLLPPDQRAVVLLVDAEGLDYRDAAAVLGVAPGMQARSGRGCPGPGGP